jgi:3-hydroxybutyryl-CoA dehydrogenase
MSVSAIGVIGAGLMGRGIAQVAATKGLNVVLVDVNDRTVKKGIDDISSRLIASKGKITASERETALRRIRATTVYDDLKPTDVVIEAVTEDFDLKAKILKQVDRSSGTSWPQVRARRLQLLLI